MKITSKITTIGAIVLGFISGVLWFDIGETLDNIYSNTLAWFIFPAILPLIISFILLFIDPQEETKEGIIKSIKFFILYYIFHWVPMILFLGFAMFAGGM